MTATRREVLATAIAGGLVMIGGAQAAERSPVTDQSAPLTDVERRHLKDGGPVVTKTFIAKLRQDYNDDTAGALREFIDPRYLKQHGLQEGPFPIQRAVTRAIHHNQLSDDPSTGFVLAETEAAPTECFLFRLTAYEDNVYILPLLPPDKESKSFKPWILRTKV